MRKGGNDDDDKDEKGEGERKKEDTLHSVTFSEFSPSLSISSPSRERERERKVCFHFCPNCLLNEMKLRISFLHSHSLSFGSNTKVGKEQTE